VVAAIDEMQRGAGQSGGERLHFIRRAERIARAVEEQHRRRDLRQVLVTAFVRLVRRMQGIAEEDQPGRRRLEAILRSDL